MNIVNKFRVPQLTADQRLNIYKNLVNWAISNKYITTEEGISGTADCSKPLSFFKEELLDDLKQNNVHFIYIQRDDNIIALEESPLAICEGSESYDPKQKGLQEIDDQVLEQMASCCTMLAMEGHLFIMELDI
jgi:hypothetical protein